MDELDAEDRAARRATRIVAASSMGALLLLSAALAHGTSPSTVNADTGTDDSGTTGTTAAASTVVGSTPASSTPAASTTTTIAATTTTACTATYTVQSGDSWYLLAQEASVTADALFAANGASPSTALYPGQDICLPSGAVVVTTTAPPVTAATPAVTHAAVTTTATVRTTVPATSHTTATSG